MYGSNHPNHGGCCHITTETLVDYRRIRALIETLDYVDQFESSAAHSTAIMAFKLVALSLPLAGDASLHGDDNVVK